MDIVLESEAGDGSLEMDRVSRPKNRNSVT